MSELKKYINYLKNKIERKGDMTELEIIRFVYIDLGKKMNFNLNYTFGNKSEKSKIYHKQLDEDAINNILKTRTAICTEMAYLLELVLKEFNINIKTSNISRGVVNDGPGHVYNIIIPKEGESYIIDLEEDLEYIQSGAKTRNFGISEKFREEHIISDEELRKIDIEKSEYIPEGYYFEDIIWMLKKAVNTTEIGLKEKLEMVLENLNVYVDNSKTQYRERIKYYERVLEDEEIFNKKEINKIRSVDFYKKTESGVICRNVILLNNKPKEEIIYLLSPENYKYEQVSMQKLASLIKNGFKNKSGISGLKQYLKEEEKEER